MNADTLTLRRRGMNQDGEIIGIVGIVLGTLGGILVAAVNNASKRLSDREQIAEKKEETAIQALQLQFNQAMNRIGTLETQVLQLGRELDASRSEKAKLERELGVSNARLEALTIENVNLRAQVLNLEGERAGIKLQLNESIERHAQEFPPG